MKTLKKTYKWFPFNLDFRNVEYKLWLLIGEAQSKCEHIAGVPLRPSTAEKLHQVYLAKGALATTAIEGNTLSEDEVLDRLDGKLKLPPSKEYLGQEVDNIIEACNSMGEKLFNGESIDLSIEYIKQLNHKVLEKLPPRKDVVPGEIRRHQVGVGRYLAADPADCEYLLKELCIWLNEKFKIPKENEIAFSILKAIVAHLFFVLIHPFGDGNGRTARLIEFQILLSAGVPSAAAHLLSNHYNQTRNEYSRQLDMISRQQGDVVPFMHYGAQGFLDGLQEQLKIIRSQQWDVTWRNYVHELFKDKTSVADIRQRHLILDLSIKEDLTPLSEVKHVSTRMAEAYAKNTSKTLARDLNKLIQMGLIEKTTKGVRAKREVILAFLPRRKSAN